MALVPLRKVLDHAAEHGYGVAAFNVNNMEQIQSIMEAAKETNSPVIIQASRGARTYSQDAYLRHLMLAASNSILIYLLLCTRITETLPRPACPQSKTALPPS